MRKKRKQNPPKYKKILLSLVILSMLGAACYYGVYEFNKYNLEKEKASEDREKSSENYEYAKEKAQENELDKAPEIVETPKKQEVQTEVVLSSAGDCTLGHDDKFGYANSLPQALKNNGNDYAYFFKNVSEIFKADDVTTVNLETTFTNATAKADKEFTFKAPTEYAKSLPLGSVEGVNVSNNHIYDYLDKGYKDTLTAVKGEGVNYFGEGTRWLTEINGNKLAFLGYRGFSDNEALLKKLNADISELKSEGRTVIINFHWGEENAYYPNDTQKHIAHYAIDQGADLIIGHHPHVVQGIEKYKNKFIAYSLGNFAFGGNMNPNDKDTFIIQTKFIFKDNKLSSYGIKVIPCSISSVNYINDYCPTPLQGDRKLQLFDKLNKLSMNLGFNLSDEFVFVDAGV